MTFKTTLAGIGAAAAVAFAAPAAAVTYQLNNGGSAFTGLASWGTVDLVQSGADVNFTVTLVNGFDFVTTGNQNSHSSFTFNTTGVVLADIVNIDTPSAATYAAWTTAGNSPFGTFTFGIHCTSCSNGAGGADPDPLTFKVKNAVINDFLSTSAGGTAAYFAADIYGPSGSGQNATGTVGITGLVPGIPEPQTYALMLAGLAAVGFMARRRRQV